MLAPVNIVNGRKAKFRQAALAGRGNLYTYGFDVITQDKQSYVERGKHLVEPICPGFEPNPYVYQYDLEVHLFINYDKLIERELKLIKRRMLDEPENAKQLNIKLEFIEKYGTGLTRDEHFWNAASLRWPTKTEGKKEKGLYIREPWAEDFIREMCKGNYVNTFGGSGQGKTHRALGFMAMLWDHYIDTELGGRCCYSTVAETKMKGSTWPYLQRIYRATQRNISLYAGRGIVFGEYTIARPLDRKGAGSIKGILLPRRNDSSGVDKLTGSHGHPLGIYHIDELQNTPDAPVEASPNFLQNCDNGWITSSGNYDLNTDALGKNVTPVKGWDSVDENTHIYEGVNALGIKCRCIHYNNNLSPAYDGEGAEKWGHILPTKKKKDKLYPNEVSRRTNAYRRLWIGWRQKESSTSSVLNKQTLKEMGCMDENPNWDNNYPITHGWSFDSAPASVDRNILTHFADGVDKATGRWKIHMYESIAIEKCEVATEYCERTSEEILKWSRLWGVQTGHGIMDWTNVTGLPEKLKEKGFNVRWMVYNQAPPDGIRRDKRNGEVLRPVLIDSITNKFAHTEAANQISMGALLTQGFAYNGQLTGLCEDFINEQNSGRSYEDELCLRKFILDASKQYGELSRLEPKHSKSGTTGFTKTNGFSPDILDTIFQAAAFCAMYRGMIPGYRDGSKLTYRGDFSDAQSKQFKEESSIYEEDAINPFKTNTKPAKRVEDFDYALDTSDEGYW